MQPPACVFKQRDFRRRFALAEPPRNGMAWHLNLGDEDYRRGEGTWKSSWKKHPYKGVCSTGSMRVLLVVWLQQMTIRKGDQKEKRTGGREEAAKRGEGGWTESRAAWKTSISKDKCKCLFSSPWKFSMENVKYTSIQTTRSISMYSFHEKIWLWPTEDRASVETLAWSKIKPLLHWKKLQEFQMASGQRLGICLCVGKGEVRIHDEMEPAEDVMKGRKPKQCWKKNEVCSEHETRKTTAEICGNV